MKKIILVFLLILFSRNCFAEIPDELAVRAIMGEASGEGYESMQTHASAIRNRGTLRGVYGCYAPHVWHEPEWVWAKARQAWKDSATFDYASGADHWGSKACDKDWIAEMEKKMDFIKEVNGTRFYKER